METKRLALTLEETARELRLGRNKTLELIHSGQIAHKRVGRRLIIPRAALERFLEADVE